MKKPNPAVKVQKPAVSDLNREQDFLSVPDSTAIDKKRGEIRERDNTPKTLCAILKGIEAERAKVRGQEISFDLHLIDLIERLLQTVELQNRKIGRQNERIARLEKFLNLQASSDAGVNFIEESTIEIFQVTFSESGS